MRLFLKEKAPKRTLRMKQTVVAVPIIFLSFSFLRRFFLFTEEKKAAKEMVYVAYSSSSSKRLFKISSISLAAKGMGVPGP